jgi:hypothetical protein
MRPGVTRSFFRENRPQAFRMKALNPTDIPSKDIMIGVESR